MAETDWAVIVAKCAMEGHDRACRQCGWTGTAADLTVVGGAPVWRKAKLPWNRSPPQMRGCPGCCYVDELVNFRVQEDDLNL